MSPETFAVLTFIAGVGSTGLILFSFAWITLPSASSRQAAQRASHPAPGRVAALEAPRILDVAALAEALAAEHELPWETAQTLVDGTLAALAEAGSGGQEVTVVDATRFRVTAWSTRDGAGRGTGTVAGTR